MIENFIFEFMNSIGNIYETKAIVEAINRLKPSEPTIFESAMTYLVTFVIGYLTSVLSSVFLENRKEKAKEKKARKESLSKQIRRVIIIRNQLTDLKLDDKFNFQNTLGLVSDELNDIMAMQDEDIHAKELREAKKKLINFKHDIDSTIKRRVDGEWNYRENEIIEAKNALIDHLDIELDRLTKLKL